MTDKFLDFLRWEKGRSPHTIKAYRKDLAQFEQHFQTFHGHQQLQQATYQDLRSWVISLMDAGQKEESINRKIASLRMFFGFLLREGLISSLPTTNLRLLKKPKLMPGFLQEKEVNLLLNSSEIFPEGFEGMRDKMVIELLYATGIRREELIGLKCADIDLEQAQLVVLGKGKKYRAIPLLKNLHAPIDNYLAQRTAVAKCPYFIVTNKGKKAYPMLIDRIVKKYLPHATTKAKVSPHLLRHTFATHLINKGADIQSIKKLLGHQSMAATQIYTHVSLEKLKDIFQHAHPKEKENMG